jgi:transcriptional regulator with XRE-family HTH domain
MNTGFKLPLPVVNALRKLGRDICDARRRRRITMKLLAERANINRKTLARIEKGDQATSIGSYAAVLFSLGMADRLADLADAKHDLTGRQIEDENLPKRVRLPKNLNQ